MPRKAGDSDAVPKGMRAAHLEQVLEVANVVPGLVLTPLTQVLKTCRHTDSARPVSSHHLHIVTLMKHSPP
jgi:hypothetical protein